MKEIPVLFRRKEECCGCYACYTVCPQNAISMEPDEEGFEYPRIEADKCVCCHLCLRVCPVKENGSGHNKPTNS